MFVQLNKTDGYPVVVNSECIKLYEHENGINCTIIFCKDHILYVTETIEQLNNIFGTIVSNTCKSKTHITNK